LNLALFSLSLHLPRIGTLNADIVKMMEDLDFTFKK
jgi:hypothetical protein